MGVGNGDQYLRQQFDNDNYYNHEFEDMTPSNKAYNLKDEINYDRVKTKEEITGEQEDRKAMLRLEKAVRLMNQILSIVFTAGDIFGEYTGQRKFTTIDKKKKLVKQRRRSKNLFLHTISKSVWNWSTDKILKNSTPIESKGNNLTMIIIIIMSLKT